MLTLADARYRCTSCGDCCRGWDVPLAPGEADAFRRLAAPLVPKERLAGAVRVARQSGVKIDALVGAGGQCALLDDAQLCKIHAAHGGAAKPRACQIFPFTFVATPTGEVRVGLSYACPAVIDGEGAPLGEQRGEIEALFHGAVDGTRYLLMLHDPVALGDAQSLGWADAARLVDELARALDGGGGLAERLCRAGALAALVQAKLETGAPFAAAFAAALSERDALVAEALAAPPEVDRLSRALFRTLLKSTEPGGPGALGRVGGALASLFSTGRVRLRGRGGPTPDGAAISELRWDDAARVRPGLGAAGEELLTRWARGAIAGLTFFGDAAFGLSIVAGLDLLVLSAAVAAFLARAYAAQAGRDAIAFEDVRAGLRQLDAGVAHRGSMPPGFARALAATASLDLLREQLT